MILEHAPGSRRRSRKGPGLIRTAREESYSRCASSNAPGPDEHGTPSAAAEGPPIGLNAGSKPSICTASVRLTLSDVAAACGVSQMTVSNAYSRPDQLSAELRDRSYAPRSGSARAAPARRGGHGRPGAAT